MKYKVSELTGDKLNHAVALAQGWKYVGMSWRKNGQKQLSWLVKYDPVNDWAQCGKLIEEFNINIVRDPYDLWSSDNNTSYPIAMGGYINEQKDADLKTAVCRCVAYSAFGEYVELPEWAIN